MKENNLCPGCGRHCDLNAPHCGRGEEYARTGQMPEHGKEHHHRHERRITHYQAADTNDKLIINLRDLAHILRFLYEGKASQKRILIILKEVEPITQRDLTERLGIQPGSASEILSKLESAGLILRTQNENDRRTTDVSLTDAGREQATEALAQRQKRHEELFSCLSEEEKQELLGLLERVCTDWGAHYCRNGHHGGHGCHAHHDGQGNFENETDGCHQHHAHDGRERDGHWNHDFGNHEEERRHHNSHGSQEDGGHHHGGESPDGSQGHGGN